MIEHRLLLKQFVRGLFNNIININRADLFNFDKRYYKPAACNWQQKTAPTYQPERFSYQVNLSASMSQPLGKLIGVAAKAVSDKRNELIEVQLLEMLKIRRPGQHLSGAGIPSDFRIPTVIAHIDGILAMIITGHFSTTARALHI